MKLFLPINFICESQFPIISPKIHLDEIDELESAIDKNMKLDVKIDKSILDSFQLKDNLNQEIWTGSKLNPDIQPLLIKIANDFIKDLNIDSKVVIKDIIFTGSLANFNWSKYSDIDLHIVLDFNQFDAEPKFVEDYFKAQKNIWNAEHDIHIKNFPIEIYVQNTTDKLEATAIYSVLKNKWILNPNKIDFKLDKTTIKDKAGKFINQLRDIKQDYSDKQYQTVVDKVKKLKDKIKQMRFAGLEKGGEFSNENLVFKVLRRTQFMDVLDSFKAKAYDNLMSVSETLNEAHLVKKPTDREIIKYFYTDDGFFDINNATEFAKNFLDVNIIKTIGIGGNGAAYLTDKGTKIKFTYSEDEYIFAKRSVGKKTDYMADYYSADKITDDLFVIEMEFIKPLSDKNKLELKNYYNNSISDRPNLNKRLKDRLAYIKNNVGMFGNDLLNYDNYGIKNGQLATFDPVSEETIDETNTLKEEGVVLIKGKQLEDGTCRLYAAYVRYTNTLNRTKTDGSDAKPVTMVTLNPKTNIYRVKIDNGKLMAAGVAFPTTQSKEANLAMRGNSIGLNYNKTPFHTESLKFKDIATCINALRSEITNLPNIRWIN